MRAFHAVYTEKVYYVSTFLFSFLIFAANPLLRNYRLLLDSPSPKLAWSLLIASPATTSLSSLVVLIIISLLSGIVFTFSLYLVRRQLSAGIGAGVSGALIGLFAPACSACAVGVFGLVGLSGFLAVLPFKGSEIGVVGIILLTGSIVYLSHKVTGICKIR